MLLLLSILSCHRDGTKAPAVVDDTASVTRTDGSDSSPTGTAEEAVVVVVGAGPAGLAAAVEFEAAGLHPVVLDMSTRAGGTARWAAGQILMAGTSTQEAAGVVDSPEALIADWSDIFGVDPEVDPWIAPYAQAAPLEIHDWLLGMGVVFSTVDAGVDSGPVARVHEPEGRGEALVEALLGTYTGEIRLGVEVTGLLVDGDAVTGVRWRSVDEDTTGEIHATAVVLATGGFARDLDRVREAAALPAELELVYDAPDTAVGSGLALTAGLQPDTRNLGAYGFYFRGIPRWDGDRSRAITLNGLCGGLYVTGDGDRFLNEDECFALMAPHAALATGSTRFFAVFDQIQAEALVAVAPDTTFEGATLEDILAHSDHAFQADAVDALAEVLGAPRLPEVVSRFNAAVVDGVDPDFGRPLRAASALDVPPFYAFLTPPSSVKTFGGLVTDTSGRVLDVAGAPIPGLFAAGELTGMAGGNACGSPGCPGSLGLVMFSGRVAARTVLAGR